MGWIDGFFENRGWAGIVQRNATTGLLESGGTAITGIASYTYAQFAAFTAGEKAALAGIPIHINDLHQSSDGIGGSYVVRDASPAGWAQVSGPMYYATFDLVPAAGSYPGWRYRVGSGIGVGGADICDTGTRLRYVNGWACVSSMNADILHTTDFSVEKIAKSYAIPRNNGKAIIQDGDHFELRTVAGRPTLSATTVTRKFRFGTGNAITDTLLEQLNPMLAAGQFTGGELNILQRRSSTAMVVVGAASGSKWISTSGQAQLADVMVTNMDTNASYLTYSLVQNADTNEAVALKHFYLMLVHGGA